MVSPISMPIPPLGYGGSQRVCCNLALGLKKYVKNVFISGVKGSEAFKGMNVIESIVKARRGAKKKDYLNYFKDIAHKIKSHKIDLIHGHGHWIEDIASCFPNVPIVSTIHGHEEKLPQNASLVFVSHSQKKNYETLDLKQDFTVIYNPINLSEFPFISKKENYLIFMAKLNWKVKGLDMAMRVAKKSGHQLIICGNGLSFFKRLMLPSFVSYGGEVWGEKKGLLLGKAKALLYPTKWPEPFGLAPAEANACGTASLVLNNGAMKEVVKDQVSGFVCSSEEQMLEKINFLNTIKPKACRNWVENNFSHEKIALKYFDFYKNILGKK